MMNELIKELAEQAEVYADTIVDEGGEFHLEYTQKFAELLITNVLAIVKNNTYEPCPYNESYDKEEAAERTANNIRDDIKYNFGVEL